MHLDEELRLVLGDSALYLGTHKQLIVVVENLEHLVCSDSLGELLLKQLGQLRFNFGSAALVCFLGSVPQLLAFFGDV